MKDKILVWIGNSFLMYGITKSLIEKYDCETYGISGIDDNSKKFLEKQEISEFKKIWFYPDHISNKKLKPDLQYLKNFEKKFNVNLCQIIDLDRRLSHINRNYRFSYHELCIIMEQAARFFEQILEEVKPDFFILEIPVNHDENLIYEMCKSLGIRTVLLQPTRLGYTGIISDEIDKFHLDLEKNPNTEKNMEPIDYINKFSVLKQIQQLKYRYKISKKEKFKAIVKFLLSSDNNFKKHYINYGKTKIKTIKESGIGNFLRKRTITTFLKNNALRTIESNSPFVYFPMHKEPERYFNAAAPYFTNQFVVISNIAKSLPIDYKLYVKEHPVMLKTTMWARSISFYRKILELPNVELIHPDVDAEFLMKHCSLVATINGSSSLIAATHNKPSIIFNDPEFSKLSCVFSIKKIDDLPKILQSALKTKVNKNEVINYLQKLDNECFLFDDVKYHVDFNSMFPYPGFNTEPKYPNEKIQEFLDMYKSTFNLLAEEFIKKIKKYKNN